MATDKTLEEEAGKSAKIFDLEIQESPCTKAKLDARVRAIPGHRRQTKPTRQNHKAQVGRLRELLGNQARAGVPDQQPGQQLLASGSGGGCECHFGSNPYAIREKGKS